MKKASLILITIALMSSAALNARAAALNARAGASALATLLPHRIVQDELARARNSVQSSDAVEIKFEGLRNIKEADLLKALRERRAGISKASIKDPVKVYLTAHAIREFLAERGYLKATVTVRQEPAPSVTNRVVFAVNEGERARIAEVEFEGNKFLSDEQLLDSIKWAGKKYGLRCLPSVEYDAEVFESCLRIAATYLRSKGYLQAKLGTPKRRENERGLTLVVPVTEGELYRLGAIKVEGATIFTPEQILGMLDLKAGDVANSVVISHWLQQKLKEAYGEMGYIQYEFDIEPDFQPPSETASGGIANFQVTISEGKRFFVREIRFRGAARMANEELRRLLYLHEGEPFNQKKLVESVKNLHRLGLSDGDAERDVDYRTSEGEGLIDIVFTLKGQPTRAATN